MEPQTKYHLLAKDKVAEQHIWKKNPSCNSLSPLLKVDKIDITRLSLGLSPQNQQNFQGCENSLGQLIDKKSLAVVVLEKSAWHTHAHTHMKHFIISLSG